MNKFLKVLSLAAVSINLLFGSAPCKIAPVIVCAEEATGNAELTARDYVRQLIWYHANEQHVNVERTLWKLKKFSTENHTADYDQWKLIMDYWRGVDSEDPEYYTESYDVYNNGANIPEGWPDDNSLCIVVLGCPLRTDGSMRIELKGRCKAAVQLAKQYPNAYIACAGGKTTKDNHAVTEADSMKAYITEHYGHEIQNEIIVENDSRSTVENAQNTYEILYNHYPEVKHLVVVTSQYHLKRGSILYNTVMVLKAYETGNTPIDVIGTYGWYRKSKTSEDIFMEARGVAQIAGVTIGSGPGGSR